MNILDLLRDPNFEVVDLRDIPLGARCVRSPILRDAVQAWQLEWTAQFTNEAFDRALRDEARGAFAAIISNLLRGRRRE